MKTTFGGALRGTFNIDGFYNNLYGQQLNSQFIDAQNQASPASGIINVNKSRSYAIEIDTGITPFRGFNLNGGYTYLRTKLISAPTVVPAAPYDIAILAADVGGDLSYSPHNRFTLTGSYALPLDPSIGQIVFGVTDSYTSSQFAVAASSSPFGRLKSFDTVNLNLNWNHVAGTRIDASIFATNVTNKTYKSTVAGLYTSTGVEFARYGEQRVVGAKLRLSF